MMWTVGTQIEKVTLEQKFPLYVFVYSCIFEYARILLDVHDCSFINKVTELLI